VSRSETRRLLILEPERRRHRLRLLRSGAGQADPRADYSLLSGEALCQYLLRETPGALVLARGPMPFLSGNKMTVGYLSPLTGVPHYSFVGGRGFAELVNLGLDAIVLLGQNPRQEYIVVAGRAPNLSVEWKPTGDLPPGQRSAYYWLQKWELDGRGDRGSILTIGEGARLGYHTANLGVDGLYHAGRGGAGSVFQRFAAALVLRGNPVSWRERLGSQAEAFWNLREGEIRQRLEQYTDRLSRRAGGTLTKLYATGSGERPTLPARNARQLGYSLASLDKRKMLDEIRAGQTGCHWCQVNCRHWHWVAADYAPQGRDRFLDDFEPTYALHAMLDLQPEEDAQAGWLRLLQEVDRSLLQPIEQMGCDAIDIGVGLAGLFEGLEQGVIPPDDVPAFLRRDRLLGDVEVAAQAVDAMRGGDPSPALRAVGDGPQALAERYPGLQARLFTSGPGSMGNAGHANKLWTFLMPFSRFFSHYSGQLYKIEGELPLDASSDETRALFDRVVSEALQREFFGVLCNALSLCAFTAVLFSEDGRGVTLDEDDLLVRTLACYGIETSREELEWFAEAFWAQSMVLKMQFGWQPPTAAALPDRVFEALSLALDRPAGELRRLMDRLIAEWKRQAGGILYKYGYEIPEGWQP
jgi:aldehyde:ferredoxin oxidoreductase